jgi:hypothetical protein
LIDRQVIAALKTLRHRDVLLVGVARDLAAQNAWLRERLIELHARVKTLDGITPVNVPPWPTITVPPELRELLPPEA